MRDKTASRFFRMEKRLEKALHLLLPRWFIPLYTLVTFTRTPYAEAVARARLQWRAVKGAAAVLTFLAAVFLTLWMGPWN